MVAQAVAADDCYMAMLPSRDVYYHTYTLHCRNQVRNPLYTLVHHSRAQCMEHYYQDSEWKTTEFYLVLP